MLEGLLKKADENVPLVSFEDKTWSQFEFVREVIHAGEIIHKTTELDDKNFILLNMRHPVVFYAYLLAMINAGYRIIVPNRDFFSRTGERIDFAAQIISQRNDNLEIIKNEYFVGNNFPYGNIVVFSSGSTGKPKGIVHQFDNFLNNAASVLQKVNMNRNVNLTWLPPYLVSAISHFVVHWMSNSHLIFDEFQNLKELPKFARTHPSLGVVGSPVHVTNAVSILPSEHKPTMFFSSGDVISHNAIDKLLNRFPSSVFYYVYGLAEIAGRFFVNNVTKKSNLPVDSLGEPISGCFPAIEDGRILVQSDYLFSGYIIDNTFIPSLSKHDSGDMGITKKDAIYIIGRSNDEIKVLGNKVNLKYLETQIKNVLETDELVLVPSRNEKFGTLIAMVIKDASFSRVEIMKKLRKKLESHEMPHLYYFADEFPFTQTMKVDRKAIEINLNHYSRII